MSSRVIKPIASQNLVAATETFFPVGCVPEFVQVIDDDKPTCKFVINVRSFDGSSAHNVSYIVSGLRNGTRYNLHQLVSRRAVTAGATPTTTGQHAVGVTIDTNATGKAFYSLTS